MNELRTQPWAPSGLYDEGRLRRAIETLRSWLTTTVLTDSSTDHSRSALPGRGRGVRYNARLDTTLVTHISGEVWDVRGRSAHRIMFANCQWADPGDAEGWITVLTDPGYQSPRDASLVRSPVVATRFEFLAERYSLLGSGVADQAVAAIALRAA